MYEFTSEELTSELLPSREALYFWGNMNVANISATNVALAQNAGSHWSSAYAAAGQSITVFQG
jgi:hypothetical protein